jgi:two-component system, sensor histidine kinase PdtaS
MMYKKGRYITSLWLIVVLIWISGSAVAGNVTDKFGFSKTRPLEIIATGVLNNGPCALATAGLTIPGLKPSLAYIPILPALVIIILAVFGVTFIAGGIIYFSARKRNALIISSLKEEVKQKSQCLEIANEERDWLVKELHHRVKNNLQIITSLLNTQRSYLENEEAIRAIRNCQHRLHAIALVHQKLYQAESLSRVDMVVYTHELLEYLKDAYDNQTRHIVFMLDMDPLDLEVSMAVSFGLILNEAISNIFKYAFPRKKHGKVSITLKTDDAQNYSIVIADNGIGIDAYNGWFESNSFGKKLIAGLASQLGAIYETKDDNGLQLSLKFSKKEECEEFTS